MGMGMGIGEFSSCVGRGGEVGREGRRGREVR